MKLNYEEVINSMVYVGGYNFWEKLVMAWDELSIAESVSITPCDNVEYKVVKIPEDKIVNFKGILDESTKPIMTVEVFIGLLKLGEMNVLLSDLDVASKEEVNQSIAKNFIESAKSRYFWFWYQQVVHPAITHQDTNGIVETLKNFIDPFGYRMQYLWDANLLSINIYKEEPFKIVYNTTQSFAIDILDVHMHSKNMVMLAAFDILSHVFFNEANGFNATLDTDMLND